MPKPRYSVALIQRRLAFEYHRRQVVVYARASRMAREIKATASRMTRKAVELSATTAGFNLRELQNRLDVIFAETQLEMRDQFAQFGRWALRYTAEAFLKAVPTPVIADAIRRKHLREQSDPLRILLSDDIRGLPPEQVKALIAELIVSPASEEAILRWLSDAPPGGMSWDMRLRRWNAQARGRFLTEITQGLAAGETPDYIERRLRPIADGVGYKSERIARTEAVRVAERANLQMCDEFGDIIAGQQILAVIDEWTRPHHAIRNGRIYWKGDDGTYRDDQGNLMPALPDEPNCRCMTVPVVDLRQEMRRASPETREQYAKAMKLSPGPADSSYIDWWRKADREERITAVGAKRYHAAREKLGRNPEWYELIDEAGNLLPPEYILEEPADVRRERIKRIRAMIRGQEKTLPELGVLTR